MWENSRMESSDRLLNVLRRIGNISATLWWKILIKSDRFRRFEVSLYDLKSPLFFKIQHYSHFRAKCILLIFSNRKKTQRLVWHFSTLQCIQSRYERSMTRYIFSDIYYLFCTIITKKNQFCLCVDRSGHCKGTVFTKFFKETVSPLSMRLTTGSFMRKFWSIIITIIMMKNFVISNQETQTKSLF